MKDLKNKNCLLTGAASGIGRSLAFGLANEGMNLFLADIDMEGTEEVAAQIRESGTKVFTGKCDVSKYEDIENLAERFYSKFDQLDLLINNAGIGGGGLVETLELDDWKHILDINTWSIIYAIKVFLPKMLEQGTGHFVNTGSGAGVVGIPYHIQYIASKFAVVGITEALYSELKHNHPGIDFSVICPTHLKTNIIDRTPLNIAEDYLVDVAEGEIGSRMDEFKSIFWEKYMAHAMPVDKAVARYIKGIKKNKLYIFDQPRLRIGMFLKSIAEPVYKRFLRSEGVRNLNIIKDTLSEMGIKTKDLSRADL